MFRRRTRRAPRATPRNCACPDRGACNDRQDAQFRGDPGASGEVYLGRRGAGNLPRAGSARPVRSFSGWGAASGGSAPARAPAASHREALPATAFAFDVRIPEAEGLIEPLLHEIDDRPIDQRQALGIHEDPYSPVLEDCIARLWGIGVVDDVREPG